MNIYDGMIEVRSISSFSLVEMSEFSVQGEKLKRLKCFSIPSGAGIAKAPLCDTGLFECVGGSRR